MKNLSTFIRSFFSMGVLGLIFLLMAIAIFIGSGAAELSFSSFEVIWQRAEVLATLEDKINVSLREMELYELQYTYKVEYEIPPGNELTKFTDRTAEINQTLDALVAEGHFSEDLDYTQESIDLLAEFRDLLQEHTQTFNRVVQAYQGASKSGDFEEAQKVRETSTEENNNLQILLEDLVRTIDYDQKEAAQSFPQDITLAVAGISVCLIIIFLMGLWGYRAINMIIRPLVDLTNAVMAMGGDQYRPELLDAVRKLSNPSGRFACAAEAFAKAIEQRDASLKQQISHLREQLFESRRQRLKISKPNQ